MSEFIINPNRLDGYPSIDDIDADFSPTQESPCPTREFATRSSLLNGYPSMYNWINFSPTQEGSYPFSMFRTDSSMLDGYPSMSSFKNFSPTQERPYPFNMFRNTSSIISGYPSTASFRNFSPTQERPFPTNMFSVNPNMLDEYPSFEQYGYFSPTQERPFPINMLSCENDYLNKYPTHRYKKQFETFGAFKDAVNLRNIVIPPSVKYIANWALFNTKIREVTIAPDCVYFRRSFPENCVVNYYTNQEMREYEARRNGG